MHEEDAPLLGASAPRRSRKPLLVVAGSVALVLATALLSHSSGVSEKEAVTVTRSHHHHTVPSIVKAQSFVDYCFQIFTAGDFEKVSAVLDDKIVFTSIVDAGRVYGKRETVLKYMQTFPPGCKGVVTNVWKGIHGGQIWITIDLTWNDPSVPGLTAVWKIDTEKSTGWSILLCTRTDANRSVARRVDGPVGVHDALAGLTALWSVGCHEKRFDNFVSVGWTPDFFLLWRPGPKPVELQKVTSKEVLSADLLGIVDQLPCQAKYFVADYYQESEHVVHAVMGDESSSAFGLYYTKFVKSKRTGIWQIEEEVVNV